jgi:phosphoribosyl 1,2-cyclic phosphate phosphodiesterase
LPVLGFRVNDFTYITDANYIDDAELEKIKGSKVVVLNALRKEQHYSHFNLEQAVEIIKIIKPEDAYFTHISHHLGLHEAVENELPEHMYLAYDGLQIIL